MVSLSASTPTSSNGNGVPHSLPVTVSVPNAITATQRSMLICLVTAQPVSLPSVDKVAARVLQSILPLVSTSASLPTMSYSTSGISSDLLGNYRSC